MTSSLCTCFPPFIPLHFLCTHLWQLVHCIELLPTSLPHTPHGHLVTPENFTLKLRTRDYFEGIIYYTICDVDCFSADFSPNKWNITLLWLFSCTVLFFLIPTPSSNCAADIHALWLKRCGSAQGQPFWGLKWSVHLGGNVPPKPTKNGRE